MTEQEKREKAIEELAQFMCETGEKSCAECKGESDVQCAAWNEAVRLHDYILHKEQEVRKDIIYGVATLVEIIEPDEEVACYLYRHLYEDCKEYGVNEKDFAERFPQCLIDIQWGRK